MFEKRKSPRRRTFKAGAIAFNGTSIIDCIVKNISDGGAGLIVETPVGIPDHFKLLIAKENFMQPCRVVWRASNRIGVAFTA
ncbi:MAG TPA: PilZ domain-containing protein [Xanthobacteraceae bacterium]|nr:PilZ domain-containing protein [Xanthobacteraceae bacterium]